MSESRNKHEGGCLCGAVRYAITGEPSYSANCHCRSCRRAVGAGFVTWTAARHENFAVTKGEITIYPSSPGMDRGFCNKCGSSLTGGGANWDDIFVTSATLDDPTVAKPTTNVYLEHQVPWVALDQTLRNHQQFPD